MPQQLHLQLLTPQKVLLDKQTDFVVLCTRDGEKGILPSHEPCTVLLGEGTVTLRTGNDVTDAVFVLGGLAQVENGRVTVLTSVAAATSEEIEELLARMEAAKADRQSQEARSELEVQRAETALRNALVRMESSSYSVLGARLNTPLTEREVEQDQAFKNTQEDEP